MNQSRGTRRISFARSLVVALAALVVGGMVSLGMTAPAFATPPDFTVKLTDKAGVALPAYDVYPIDLQNGVQNPQDVSTKATPVTGKPGYYAMSLNSGDTYTLAMSPNGAALNSATFQYLGGTTFLAGATQFIPTSSNDFLAATVATGVTITGKVTGPTGTALNGAEVDAFQFDGTNWVRDDFTLTSSTGTYTFSNAVPGSYRFEFYAPGGIYPPIFSGGATTFAAATSTFIPVGTTATVNQKFAVGTGMISGTVLVSDSTDSNPADGDLFYDSGRVPVAFPVTAETSGHATALDLDKAIAGKPASSHGKWTISNLPAGNYVVEMDINYFGEGTQYLSTQAFGVIPTLAQAKVFPVTAGHTIANGTSVLPITFAADGSDPQFTIEDSSNAAVQGAQVVVSPVNDPLETVTGTSDASGHVALAFSNGNPVTEDHSQIGLPTDTNDPLIPGYYTVTVTDPDNHGPSQQTMYFDFGLPAHIINLPDVGTAPGFSSPAAIAETDLTAGTSYTVTATAARGDALPLTYQWLRNATPADPSAATPIFGATSDTYAATGADVGDHISVRVAASSFGFNPVYSYADVNDDPLSVTTIGDSPVIDTDPSITPATDVFVGTTLQANAGTWQIDGSDASGLNFTYLWSTGATTSTYVVQPADIGTPISVTVTAHKAGYTDSDPAVSPVTVTPVIQAAPVVTVAPTVTKTVSLGVTTYKVSTGTWNVPGVTFTYEWFLGGNSEGVTTNTITSTQVGTPLPGLEALTAVVTASKTGYVDGNSAQILASKGTDVFEQTVDPTILDLRTSLDVPTSNPCLNFGDHLAIDQHGTWTITNGDEVPSSYTYQWYRLKHGAATPVAIAGATKPTYTVGTADMSATNDTEIYVVETPVSAYYAATPGDQTDVGTAMWNTTFLSSNPATPYDTLPLPTATVSGIPVDGHTVSAKVGSWGTTGVTDTYQWFGCSPTATPTPCTDPNDETQYQAIPLATKSTLLLSESDYPAVFVTVTGNKTGFAVPVDSAPAIVLDGGAIYLSSAPTINGIVSSKAHTGATLTVTGGTPSVTGTTIVYTWQTSPDHSTWSQVGIGTSYKPTLADFNQGFIRVEETAAKPGSGLSPAIVDSFFYVIDTGTLKAVHLGTFTKTTSTFTYHSGTYTPALVTGDVQWFVDGAPAENGFTHARGAGDIGAAIWVVGTYSEDGYTAVHSHLQVQLGATTTGAESIVGARYGDTLSLSNATPFSNVAGEVPVLTYQWYSNAVAIAGQTHATFTPTSSYVGKHITVKVKGTTPDYLTGSVTVATVPSTLGSGLFQTPSNPTITNSGVVEPGVVQTAVPDTLVDYGTTGITFAFAWQRSTNSGVTFTAIPGATTASYTPVATDVTDELRVVVTATKKGYLTSVLTSDPVTVDYSPTLATLTPPVATGTGQVADLLTTTAGVWNTPGITLSYQWFVDGTAMPGAVGTSFTPVASEVGDLVYAQVTASRAGYQTVSVPSNLIVVTDADAPSPSVFPTVTFASGIYSVSPGTWNVDGLTYTYQWQVNGTNGIGTDGDSVAGSTSSTYIPDPSESGGALQVVVTVSRAGYTTTTETPIWPSTLP